MRDIEKQISDLLKLADDCKEEVLPYSSRIIREAAETIRRLSEKQIPKKPTLDGDAYAPDGTFIWDKWICPNCRNEFEVDYDDYDYCPNCGQRIDKSVFDEGEVEE